LIGCMSALAAVLRDVPIFDGLGDAVLERLAARCVPRAVGAGFMLFRAGERCTGLYVVLEGRVRIYRTSPDGREQTLAVEGPGRPVAELPLFDGGPYPATAVTTAPSRLMFLPRGEFEHAFRTDPDVAASVVRALGVRLRHMVQLVETLAFRDVAARLAMLLADHAERRGQPEGGGVALDLERTQEELAAEIGTARESVSRAMKQLKVRGLIRKQTGMRLLLAPAERLRAWARGGGE
jgi:CRP/FNR family transcriptional regulator, cyclic AMP receptor protein